MCSGSVGDSKGFVGVQVKAGTSLRQHHESLRADMHRMMDSSEDDVDLNALAHNMDHSPRTMDDYIKESEEGLSAALGPRWNAKKLEEDADRSTRALLRGISGPRAVSKIKNLMGGLF